MSRRKLYAAAGFVTMMGIVCGVFAAPLFHVHSPGPEMLRPQWAYNHRSLGEMARDVDAVVMATVDDIRPGRTVLMADGRTPLPFTLVDLNVERVLRGEVDDSLTLEQTGGSVGDMSYYVDGDGGPYEVGERVLLFVNQQSDTDLYYLVHPQGRYRVVDNQLLAVAPDSPAGRRLDGRGVGEAIGLIEAGD